MENFGTRLSGLRKNKGLSQEQFADEVGVSRQAISRWETGTSVPELDKIECVSDYFGISLDYLVNGDQQEEAPASAVTEAVKEEASDCPAQENGEKSRKIKAGGLNLCKAAAVAFFAAFAVIGVAALATFIFCMTAMNGSSSKPDTYYFVLMSVPGWAAVFAVAFIVALLYMKKRKSK